MDTNAISLLKEKTHLPVIADPSHGIGIRKYVPQVAYSAIMAGADGVLLEIHPRPDEAFSDAQQTLGFRTAERCFQGVRETFALRVKLES